MVTALHAVSQHWKEVVRPELMTFMTTEQCISLPTVLADLVLQYIDGTGPMWDLQENPDLLASSSSSSSHPSEQ
jgi:hypothetical protein